MLSTLHMCPASRIVGKTALMLSGDADLGSTVAATVDMAQSRIPPYEKMFVSFRHRQSKKSAVSLKPKPLKPKPLNFLAQPR